MRSLVASIALLALISPWTMSQEEPANARPIAWAIRDSGRPGPTVLITGGLHGDEPAGAEAATQIAGWTPSRGRWIVVPRANERALRAGTRLSPGAPKAERNLNRAFPVRGGQVEPIGDVAQQLWRLIEEHEPEVLIDLHEGFDVHRQNEKSVGSSVIWGGPQRAESLAEAMLESVNAELAESEKFDRLKTPIGGSLARAFADTRHRPAFILETTTKGRPLPRRVRQHRILVHRLLTELKMIDHESSVRIGDSAKPGALRVGVFHDSGVSAKGPKELSGLADEQVVVRQLCREDLQDGGLDELEILVFPGGSGSGQAKALGESGREIVREFVRRGGGYVGFCAGGYLAANNYSWSLGILDLDVIDRQHWARGRGPVPLSWSAAGQEHFELTPQSPVLYVNGPIWSPSNDPDLPDATVLATFAGEVHKEGVPGGVMPNTPAIVLGRFGEGRVICSSPHPELTDGYEAIAMRLLELAAGR